MKEQLEEHRKFRNQCILMTIFLLLCGTFLSMPFEFLSNDASEGAITLFGFGIIMGLVSIFNIFTYKENKRDYNEINKYK